MLRIALSIEICTSSVRVMSQMMCIINESLFWLWFPPWSWSFVHCHSVSNPSHMSAKGVLTSRGSPARGIHDSLREAEGIDRKKSHHPSHHRVGHREWVAERAQLGKWDGMSELHAE